MAGYSFTLVSIKCYRYNQYGDRYLASFGGQLQLQCAVHLRDFAGEYRGHDQYLEMWRGNVAPAAPLVVAIPDVNILRVAYHYHHARFRHLLRQRNTAQELQHVHSVTVSPQVSAGPSDGGGGSTPPLAPFSASSGTTYSQAGHILLVEGVIGLKVSHESHCCRDFFKCYLDEFQPPSGPMAFSFTDMPG